MTKSYEQQVQEQIEQYRNTENMHDLPRAFHVWSEDFIRPPLRKVFGVDTIGEFYVEAFAISAARASGVPAFLSLGCGDGAVEIAVAQALVGRGITAFRFFCFDLSDVLLDRFRAAIPDDLREKFELVEGDLNAYAFDRRFDAIMANHSLHHMVDLEGIYKTAFDNLADTGIFVTNDMVGRNGHMRWPEAKLFVDFFWPLMSERQRNNVLLHRREERFIDHDCSGEGFEGVRAQEVLPLLLDQGFHPWKFLGTGGFIDVFVDRCFGPNFDMGNPDDAFLLRRMALMNEMMLDAGLIKPTLVLGYFTKGGTEEIYYRGRSARRSVRDLAGDPAWLADALADYGRYVPEAEFAFRAAPLVPAPVPVLAPAGGAPAPARPARRPSPVRRLLQRLSWA